jgi:hypothetical protein
MGTPTRQYRQGEKPHSVFSNFNGPNKFNQYFYIRAGVIEEVDIDKYQMTIRWYGSDGARSRVPISFPYMGPAGCIATLPEKGAMGIFGFYDEGDGKGSPLCLSYLAAGLASALNFNTVKILPDSLSTSDINEVDFKFRKLTPGDISITSPAGGMVFLNNTVEIHDNSQDSIIIRDDDQAIISTSVTNFTFADGVSISSGPALRNSLVLYDSQGNKLPNNGSAVPQPSGKDNIYIVPQGQDITYDTQFYTEYRVDVSDMANGILDNNDVNGSANLSDHDPVVRMALGNYIGPDIRDPQLYGNVLKAKVFLSDKDQKGNFTLGKALDDNNMDEPGKIGLAYSLHFPKSGAFVGVDKEGHYILNLPASAANQLGAGRSMSILAQGNLKEIWGSTALDNNSWDLTTRGGVRWNLGAHNLNEAGQSYSIQATNGISITVNSADNNGFAKTELYKANISQVVSGDKQQTCVNYTSTINGLKVENITGSSTESVQSDKSINVLGVMSETVVKEMQGKFGVRKTTITTGNDELTVIRGDITETITTFGKRSTLVTAGSIEENLLTGTYKTFVGGGSYEISVGTGTIKISTAVGAITMSGTNVAITGNVAVQINAPIVQVGNGAAIGGVVSGFPGIFSHFDYTTGVPLKGSMKVSVG